MLRNPKVQAYIKLIEADMNFAAHGNHFGPILNGAELLARASRLASASAIDLLNEEGEYDINYIREHGLEYLASAIEITTIKYPNGTEKTTKKIKVEPPKGFIELLCRCHGLDGDQEALKKAIGRALTGLLDPDDDDIVSAVTGIPKRLLQTCPLDGPVPKELLEMKEREPGTFEVEKPNGTGHKNGGWEIRVTRSYGGEALPFPYIERLLRRERRVAGDPQLRSVLL